MARRVQIGTEAVTIGTITAIGCVRISLRKKKPPSKIPMSRHLDEPGRLIAGRGAPIHASVEADAQACIVPSSARSILRIAEERGHDPRRLCRGLGFRYQDLISKDLLLSYKQVRTLILRALRQLGDPAVGIAAGACQSPVSWGLAGLAMLTFRTLGEAVQFGLQYQVEAGALVEHAMLERGHAMLIDVAHKNFDSAIEPYLIEESLAGALAVGRYLVGEEFRPLRVEFAFGSKGHEESSRRFFGCPVQFSSGQNRMTVESRWLDAPLRGYDPVTCEALRSRIIPLLQKPEGYDELIESLSNRIRFGMDERKLQTDLARTVNMSDRTLRRKMKARDTSYLALRESLRFERAKDLLQHSNLTITRISETIGYANVRAFRRAFRRWTGCLPTAYRKMLQRT